MDLTRFYRMLRKGWVLLVALALVGAATGALALSLLPRSYVSSVEVVVAYDAPPTADAADLVQAGNFAVQRAFTYAPVVTSEAVLQPVIDDLGLDDTYEDLSADVSATVELNSAVITIRARADTAEDAATLASAVTESFADYVVNTVEAPAGGGPGPVKITVIQEASVPENPDGPSTVVSAAVGGFIGVIVGLVILFVLSLTDHRVRTRRDLEAIDGLRCAGSVPARGRSAERAGLAMRTNGDPAADSYRRLVTSLLLVRDAPFAIGVSSATAEEGASDVAANLAAAFAEQLPTVALVAVDPDAVALSERLNAAVLTLDEIAARRARPALAIVGAPRDPERGALDRAALTAVVATLRESFDVVVVVAPPVLHSVDALTSAAVVDLNLLVVASGRADAAEVDAAVQSLREIGAGVDGAVLVGVPSGGPDADPALAASGRSGGRR